MKRHIYNSANRLHLLLKPEFCSEVVILTSQAIVAVGLLYWIHTTADMFWCHILLAANTQQINKKVWCRSFRVQLGAHLALAYNKIKCMYPATQVSNLVSKAMLLLS